MTEAYENYSLKIRSKFFNEFTTSDKYFAQISVPMDFDNFTVKISIFNIQENLDIPIQLHDSEFNINDPFKLRGEYPADLTSSYIHDNVLIIGVMNDIYKFNIQTGNLDLIFSINITEEDYVGIFGVFNNMVYVNFNGDIVQYDMNGNQISYYEPGNSLSDDERYVPGGLLESQIGIIYCVKSGSYVQLRLLRTNETILNILEDGTVGCINIFDNILIYASYEGGINYINLNDNSSHKIYLIERDGITPFRTEGIIIDYKVSQSSMGLSIWLDDLTIVSGNVKNYRKFLLPLRRYYTTKSSRSLVP